MVFGKLLRKLMQDVDAKRYFNEPVDPDAFGIPEYREIIKVCRLIWIRLIKA